MGPPGGFITKPRMCMLARHGAFARALTRASPRSGPAGEYWDVVENMDTYYNPIPHFGFHHAIAHSPTLWAVKLPPPDESGGAGGSEEDDDALGEGLGRL